MISFFGLREQASSHIHKNDTSKCVHHHRYCQNRKIRQNTIPSKRPNTTEMKKQNQFRRSSLLWKLKYLLFIICTQLPIVYTILAIQLTDWNEYRMIFVYFICCVYRKYESLKIISRSRVDWSLWQMKFKLAWRKFKWFVHSALYLKSDERFSMTIGNGPYSWWDLYYSQRLIETVEMRLLTAVVLCWANTNKIPSVHLKRNHSKIMPLVHNVSTEQDNCIRFINAKLQHTIAMCFRWKKLWAEA